MKINLTRSYRSKNGNTVFVYAVSGTTEQLKQFAAAQGDNHRVDEATGTPLWFTTRCVGQTGMLIITSNNKVVPDMSQYDQADSLAKQYGGNLGQELAKAAAEKLIGASAQAVTPANTPVGTPGLGKL
jgi:hypothetical protein